MVRVKVRWLAHLGELAGTLRQEVQVPRGTSVMELARIAAQGHGERLAQQVIDPHGRLVVVALVGGKVAAPDQALEDGDEIAFLPLFGGG